MNMDNILIDYSTGSVYELKNDTWVHIFKVDSSVSTAEMWNIVANMLAESEEN